jgi:hypothetical protein
MTTKFKQLLALLLLVSGGMGMALADQSDHPRTSVATVASEAPASTESVDRQAPEHLAWQRVGSPLREA